MDHSKKLKKENRKSKRLPKKELKKKSGGRGREIVESVGQKRRRLKDSSDFENLLF